MIREKILKNIHNRLSPSMPLYGIGIDGGIGGLFLFYSLYSKIHNSEEDHNRSLNIINKIDSLNSSNFGILHGYLGMALAIDIAHHCSSVQLDEKMRQIRNYCISQYLGEYQLAPIKYIFQDDFFTEGMYMIHSFEIGVENELEYYYMLERMIGEVDTCESYMTFEVEGIYKASDISILNLASLINYLTKIVEWKIYPYKAKKLLELALKTIDLISPKNGLESLLKNIYGDCRPVSLDNIDIHELSEIGYISLVFRNPDMFKKAFDCFATLDLDHCTKKELLGIGIGLEMLTINDKIKKSQL